MHKKVLLVCGSLNQTTMMHKIAMELGDFDCYFTPFYAIGILGFLSRLGLLNFTILGGQHRRRTEEYLKKNKLQVDFGGKLNNYDLVILCTDTYVPKNILGIPTILVQEGIIEPEDSIYKIVRHFRLPHFLANTSTTGLSNAYDLFCVASEGYKALFVKKGIDPGKIRVTGIPNFDNASAYLDNNFPLHHYVLAATSSTRETFQKDDRVAFLRNVYELSLDMHKPLIIKLHPNENRSRSLREINLYAPEATIVDDVPLEFMIANCDIFVTQYTSAVFIGIALNKEVHSYFNLEELRRLTPIQNGGTSSFLIAANARKLVEDSSTKQHHWKKNKSRGSKQALQAT